MNVRIKRHCKVFGTGPSTYHNNCSVNLSSLFPVHSGCIFQVLPPLMACSDGGLGSVRTLSPTAHGRPVCGLPPTHPDSSSPAEGHLENPELFTPPGGPSPQWSPRGPTSFSPLWDYVLPHSSSLALSVGVESLCQSLEWLDTPHKATESVAHWA